MNEPRKFLRIQRLHHCNFFMYFSRVKKSSSYTFTVHLIAMIGSPLFTGSQSDVGIRCLRSRFIVLLIPSSGNNQRILTCVFAFYKKLKLQFKIVLNLTSRPCFSRNRKRALIRSNRRTARILWRHFMLCITVQIISKSCVHLPGFTVLL